MWMDPANFGGVKGKLPSSILYGEVLQTETSFGVYISKMNECSAYSLSVMVFVRRKPKRNKKHEEREMRKAARMKMKTM